MAQVWGRKIRRVEAEATLQTYRQRGTEALAFIYVPHDQERYMPVTVVVGTQWGDEGKAKIIDLLSRDHSYVARYQGGHNAGHTVVVGEEK